MNNTFIIFFAYNIVFYEVSEFKLGFSVCVIKTLLLCNSSNIYHIALKIKRWILVIKYVIICPFQNLNMERRASSLDVRSRAFLLRQQFFFGDLSEFRCDNLHSHTTTVIGLSAKRCLFYLLHTCRCTTHIIPLCNHYYPRFKNNSIPTCIVGDRFRALPHEAHICC